MSSKVLYKKTFLLTFSYPFSPQMTFDNDASISYGKKTTFSASNQETLMQLFSQIAQELPNQICIEEYDSKLNISYSQLNHRASQLAAILSEKVHKLTRNGQDSEFLVALRFLPNIELIVTLLALAKCGLAYVPIAPNWPAGRVRLILKDAKPGMILTNTRVDLLYKAMQEMEDSISIYQVRVSMD